VPLTVRTDMISLFSRLRPNQFTTVHSYSFIPNIRIIGLILPARKNSKIAIMRSCHLVLVQSANIYVYSIHTYPYHVISIRFLRNLAGGTPRFAIKNRQHYIVHISAGHYTYGRSSTHIQSIVTTHQTNY